MIHSVSFASPVMALHQASIGPKPDRRTANYKPTIWKHAYLQSLTTNYNVDKCASRKEKLKEEVMHLLAFEKVVPTAQLELADDVERLGLEYLFEEEIKLILDCIYMCIKDNDGSIVNNNLRVTALCFRLLRQHDYTVTEDVFRNFMDEQGNFVMRHHNKDIVKEMLSLFEASSLAFQGENVLEAAKAFAVEHLKDCKADINQSTTEQVHHALELPLHLRMQRLEVRRYIDQYSRSVNANHVLVELAKLEFNAVQSTHQEDLKELSKWWRNMGIPNKLEFTRDRIVECFLASVGLSFDPQLGIFRQMISKVGMLVSTIDDVYDIYGTLDELELFTHAVERWDINGISDLPYYMKFCFLALYNTINQLAYDSLKENGLDITTYVKKAWADLCKSFLVEAKWYYSGYIPTFKEYMENAWISAGGYTILFHAYVLLSQDITIEVLDYLESKPNLIRFASMILRLADDLGTSADESERGDVSKSIQCYMHQTGVSEEVARECIKHLLEDTWKDMNKELYVDSPFPPSFRSVVVNLARTSQSLYLYGDGYGSPENSTKDQVISLLVEPFKLTG